MRTASVKLEKLRDADARHFLQENQAVFTKRFYTNSFVTRYKVTIDAEHEGLGRRQFCTAFNLRGGYVTQADVLKSFDAQVRKACAILHWEILCWKNQA